MLTAVKNFIIAHCLFCNNTVLLCCAIFWTMIPRFLLEEL